MPKVLADALREGGTLWGPTQAVIEKMHAESRDSIAAHFKRLVVSYLNWVNSGECSVAERTRVLKELESETTHKGGAGDTVLDHARPASDADPRELFPCDMDVTNTAQQFPALFPHWDHPRSHAVKTALSKFMRKSGHYYLKADYEKTDGKVYSVGKDADLQRQATAKHGGKEPNLAVRLFFADKEVKYIASLTAGKRQGKEVLIDWYKVPSMPLLYALTPRMCGVLFEGAMGVLDRLELDPPFPGYMRLAKSVTEVHELILKDPNLQRRDLHMRWAGWVAKYAALEVTPRHKYTPGEQVIMWYRRWVEHNVAFGVEDMLFDAIRATVRVAGRARLQTKPQRTLRT